MNGVVNAVTGRDRDSRRDDNAPVEEVSQVNQEQQGDPNVCFEFECDHRILALCKEWISIVV